MGERDIPESHTLSTPLRRILWPLGRSWTASSSVVAWEGILLYVLLSFGVLLPLLSAALTSPPAPSSPCLHRQGRSTFP